MRASGAAVRVITALACGLCLAGCGAPADDGHPRVSRAATSSPSISATSAVSQRRHAVGEAAGQYGILHGQVLRPAGLDPRSGSAAPPGPFPGPSVPVGSDPLQAYDQNGRTIATAASEQGGYFHFVLLPGTYWITEDICRVGRQVEIRGGATASMTLMIRNAC